MRTRSAIIATILLTLWARAAEVGRYEVFEHTIEHPSADVANVWEDVAVDVTLQAPSGKNWSIGGFFYDTDTWKFRFAPDEIGQWQWEYTINGGAPVSGSFTCVESDNPGFIKQNPHNPYRWVYDNGEPYYLFGVQDCIEFTQYSFNELGKENWRVSGVSNLSFEAYLDSLRVAGFNAWRLSNKNCSPLLVDRLSPNGNQYNAANMKLFDRYARLLRAHGFRIYFVIFGWAIPFSKRGVGPAEEAAMQRYIDYIHNRYGAWVDFWEVANEVYTEKYQDNVLRMLAEYIGEADPYQPSYVSMSWERPEIDELEIISPHEYTSLNESSFETAIVSDINRWRTHKKPIIYGEMGNRACSHEELSTFRWRVIVWSMFFNEAAPIFWQQHSTDYCPNMAANLYMHPDVVEYFRIYTDWREGFDVKARRADARASTNDVRVYSLSGPRHYGLYIYDYSTYNQTRSGLAVTIAPQDGGRGIWFDPKTGTRVQEVEIASGGEQQIDVPDFTADIALKIDSSPQTTGLQPAVKHRSPQAADRKPTGYYSLRGRKIDSPSPARGRGIYIVQDDDGGGKMRVRFDVGASR
jgi:hypothetical protein